jgi:mycothiol maleylpyruvate isomerase-like protein
MRTKAELLAALEASRDEVVAGLDGLDLSAGVYEGGWNGRQLLAHIASMEWTYPRILELPAATDEEAARPRDTSVTVDDYNRRQVEKRDAVPVDDLIDEFVRTGPGRSTLWRRIPRTSSDGACAQPVGRLGPWPTCCGSLPSSMSAATSLTSAGRNASRSARRARLFD